jgi:hypothetical protein
MNANPLNLCRFVDAGTALATAGELDQDEGSPVDLAHGVTLHAGMRNGIPTFVVHVAGAGDLSAVISTQPLDD